MIPYSTNVERVALACGLKGIDVEWVRHQDVDRSVLRALSGQDLVPVAELGDEVVFDSVRILEWLERRRPEPPLYPADPADRAEAETFVEWFDEVWKRPPNALAADRPPADAAALRNRVAGWSTRFDAYLGRFPFLLGDVPTVADVCAYPFLRYAVDEPDPADDDRFHRILRDLLHPGQHPMLDAWVARISALPQA
jgi:glutathione S-transferase